MKTMEVKLSRVRGALFEGTNATGQKALVDGPADLGGQGEGVRPMEMLLMSLAGCAAMDVIHILEKQQREPLRDLDVTVQGVRADAVPAVYTDITVHFVARGPVDPHKFERAVRLSVEKYCSVAHMLMKSAKVSFTHALEP